MSGGIGQILYSAVSEDRLVMTAPSETFRLVFGIHPAELEAKTAGGAAFDHWDPRFGMLCITFHSAVTP